MKVKVIDNNKYKMFSSPIFNTFFDKETGFTLTCGRTKDEDPPFSPIGPLILDIEVSTICHGVGPNVSKRSPCRWCYKTNSGKGKNMSFETYQKVINKFPIINNCRILHQIALGIGDIDSNPDLQKIMTWTREEGIIPNITVNGMGITNEWADFLVNTCGAISTSYYGFDDPCFNTIKKFTDRGMTQANIHMLLANETYDQCFDLIDKIKNDPRLEKLNALVFLLLKPRGKRNDLTSVSELKKFNFLFDYAIKNGVRIGMDSCSSPMAMKCLSENNLPYIEPCESFGLFSSYVNVDGIYFPCSFSEGIGEWKEGLNVLEADDFLKDIWFSKKLNKWRNISLDATKSCDCKYKSHCRVCPIFDITPCYKRES